MNESTFVCLFYVYLLLNKDKFPKGFVSDFKSNCFRLFKLSDSVSDFCTRLHRYAVFTDCLNFKYYKRFIKFISDNNVLLGYKSIY